MLLYTFVNNERKPLERDPIRAKLHTAAEAAEDEFREVLLVTQNLESSSFIEAYPGINATTLFTEFVKKKKTLPTMKERFELAFDETYAHLIPIIELGVTTSPNETKELDVLKQDYTEFLSWAIDSGVTQGEIPRHDSQRYFEVRADPNVPDYAILTRTRQLFKGQMETKDGTSSQVILIKRMTFSLPTPMYHVLTLGDAKITQPKTMALVEQQIDNNHKLIYPIKTGYYLKISPGFELETRQGS